MDSKIEMQDTKIMENSSVIINQRGLYNIRPSSLQTFTFFQLGRVQKKTDIMRNTEDIHFL